MSFENLKITKQFLNAIIDSGFTEPTPIQDKAIPPIIAGQDVVGIAQTGTGKTRFRPNPFFQLDNTNGILIPTNVQKSGK